ncbi:MAG: hypothetical protein V4692_06195 [Bdellovibrionota bacterium]
MKQTLAKKLAGKPEIFSVKSDPLLSSLIFCLGVSFEIGRPGWDRLSETLGKLESSPTAGRNPWNSEIVTLGGKIGLRLWIPGFEEFQPMHVDFKDILHPASLDANGRLSQIVIFPEDVAANYARRGFELVIVRDWVLNSGLSTRDSALNYLVTNRWEAETNSARLQTKLMSNRQVAFSGTHDLADHLLASDIEGFAASEEMYRRIAETYENVFSNGSSGNSCLIASYLVGLLLDDLAQPKWYRSRSHMHVLSKAVALVETFSERFAEETGELELPPSFNPLIELIRLQDTTQEGDPAVKLDQHFALLESELAV